MAGKVFYPLTSPQLSIWYTEKMYPGISISNVAGTLRINQQIDFKLMEQAINYFIKHNDGIRLRICLDENGNPRQYVSDYIYETISLWISLHMRSLKKLYMNGTALRQGNHLNSLTAPDTDSLSLKSMKTTGASLLIIIISYRRHGP